MAELLFVATIIFVAYVVFVVIGDKKDIPVSSKTESDQPEVEKPVIKEPELTAPTVVEVKAATKPARAKPAASAKKSVAAKTAEPAPAPVPTSTTPSDSLKNPKNGEVAKIPSSYNFAKRWIKDALVEEGLLDKVYKSNELDDAANAKIQSALQKLKAIDKYR